MADVDRAQLFLVGAFALAVLFVALAVLLNAAIFTENLSTQGRAPSPGSAVEYREAAVEMAGPSIAGVNYRNNSTYTDLENSLNRSIDAWSAAAGKHRASQAHVADTSVDGVTRGTRLTQDAERNFTDVNDAANWTVAADVRLRNFTASVNETTLDPAPASQTPSGYRGSSVLRFEFEDADGDEWTTYVHTDTDDNVTVGVVDDSNNLDVCEAAPGADDHAVVDFTGGRVGNQSCDALDFYDDMDEPYTLSVVNATVGGVGTGNGTYSLVVDVENTSLTTASSFGTQPFETPAVYAATFEIRYRAPDTDYEARVRVAPGEPDA